VEDRAHAMGDPDIKPAHIPAGIRESGELISKR
jgi:hypothetical protein